MGGVLYPFKEIASLANLGESRARTLRNRYEKAVPVEGEGRSKKYPKEASSILAMADRLEKSGKGPDEVMAELLSLLNTVPDSSDDRVSKLMRIIEDLSREISELRCRQEWSEREISRLNDRVMSLGLKIKRISERKSRWEEVLRAIAKFFDDLLSF